MKVNRYSRPHKTDSTKPSFIYCLWCPVAKRIRYIGKSNQPITRVYLHIFAAKRAYHRHHASRWLRILDVAGVEPKLRILLRVPDGESWQEHERSIIKRAIEKGWPLTNQTLGGEGVEFSDPLALEAAKKARRDGVTKDVRARMSASMKAAWANPETRSRIMEKINQAASLPKRRRELDEARAKVTPEGVARRTAAIRAYWSNPENRNRVSARMKEKMSDPDVGRAMGKKKLGKTKRKAFETQDV